jgi:Sulfotransferase family
MLVGIFGTGRNGSTLLTRLMDGISEVYTHSAEINFLSAFSDIASIGWVMRKTKHYAKTKPLKNLDKQVGTKKLLRYYSSQINEIKNIYLAGLKDPDNMTLGRDPLEVMLEKDSYKADVFVKSFLKSTSDWLENNKKVNAYIFKTIEVAYIQDYEILFPNMKFIHLIRDPIDCYSSLIRRLRVPANQVKRPSWYLGGDILSTMILKRWLPHAKSILKNKDKSNHYWLRYEDLVKEPQVQIDKICAWLKLPSPADPDIQTVLGGRKMKELPVNISKGGGKETPQKVVSDMHKTFNYEKVVTNSEYNLIVRLTYKYGKNFNYFNGRAPVSIAQIVREWAFPKKWEFSHSSSTYLWVFGWLVSFVKVFQRRVLYFKEIYLT